MPTTALFASEHDLLAAAHAVRGAGLRVVDAYTPYAVHGLDRALGLAPSRLTWVCFGAGLFGGTFALGFQLWTSVVDWPLVIGGKPFASVPAFVPVTFELTVLAAALTTVAALLARARLYPGAVAVAPAGVTDDRFALTVDAEADRVAPLVEALGGRLEGVAS